MENGVLAVEKHIKRKRTIFLDGLSPIKKNGFVKGVINRTVFQRDEIGFRNG